MVWEERAVSYRKPWVGRLAELFASVASFLNLHGPRFDAGRLEDEVRTLVEPALPLLMHKRKKFFAACDVGMPEDRWRDELAFYVDRILWPMLAVEDDHDGRIRTRVIGLVDAMVTARQVRAGEAAFAALPIVWRAGWAG